MIILREKIFRRDELPENEWFKADPKVEKELGTKLTIRPEYSNKWSRDMNLIKSPLDKQIINKLKKDIKNGNLYIDGDAGGDTHYLSDFSHKDSHLMSKIINKNDRLNYRVYPPKIEYNEDLDKIEYIQKVVFESCKGHGRNGAKNYSEITP